MERPRIGVLIGKRVFQEMVKGQIRRERLDYYAEAGRLYGAEVCFFRLRDANPERNTVTAYFYQDGRYEPRQVPLPDVIHNRTLFFKRKAKQKLRRLSERSLVFNGGNRYAKTRVHDLLMEDTGIRPHLPGTMRATPASIRMWMARYDELILKPDSSSIGRGICKLERDGDRWLYCPPAREKGGSRAIRFRRRLPPRLLRLIRSRSYVVQQKLPLAEFDGRPFDIRVSVQKNEHGMWQVTGMAAKVAAPGKYITNVAQGGQVHPLPELLKAFPHLDPAAVMRDIATFALRAASHLEARLPRLADIGLDVGITHQGFPVFIECNMRDLRYSFDKAGMPDAWRAAFHNPIGYAVFLLRQRSTHAQHSQEV